MHKFLTQVLLALPLATAAISNYAFPCNTSQPVAFNISVAESIIDQAAAKAKLYRPSLDLKDDSNIDWLEGPPRAEMISVAEHWADDYDWSKVQNEINSNFSHYALTVPGGPTYNHSVPLHFVHERSSDDDAIPLLLLHGWPSSHLEWSQVIKPLVSPDGVDQKFHVVAPDLPGFGFSPAVEYSGLTPSQMGFVFDNLMHALGYDRYGVVTTDAGWWVGLWMADVVPNSLIGHMTDFWLQQPNATDLERLAHNETTPEETAYIQSSQAWSSKHTGYSDISSMNPLAIGQAMTDSPVGFAGWIWHLIHASSDGYHYTPDEIITRTMMLWIQGTWGNIRTYREFFTAEAMAFPTTTVPTGVSEWSNAGSPFSDLANLQLAPRSWVERLVNLVYFTQHDAGGHFPAEKEPQLWVKDVREFFTSLQHD